MEDYFLPSYSLITMLITVYLSKLFDQDLLQNKNLSAKIDYSGGKRAFNNLLKKATTAAAATTFRLIIPNQSHIYSRNKYKTVISTRIYSREL